MDDAFHQSIGIHRLAVPTIDAVSAGGNSQGTWICLADGDQLDAIQLGVGTNAFDEARAVTARHGHVEQHYVGSRVQREIVQGVLAVIGGSCLDAPQLQVTCQQHQP